MATNTTHGTFTAFLADVAPEHRSVCSFLRDQIAKHVEIVWERQGIASYGVGPKKMTEHYAYIAPQKKHVNLGFYHGATLDDPAGLLEGTGKLLRHVKLRSLADAKRTEVKALLKASIADRRAATA